MNHEELLIELRKDNEYLKLEVKELKKEITDAKTDLREIRDAFIKYRGWIGGAIFIASCFGAAIMGIFQYIVRG